jgi:hypothetical protein
MTFSLDKTACGIIRMKLMPAPVYQILNSGNLPVSAFSLALSLPWSMLVFDAIRWFLQPQNGSQIRHLPSEILP